MIADFSELHDQVHEILRAKRVGQVVGGRDEVGNGNSLSKSLVDVALSLGKIDQDIDFQLYIVSCRSFASMEMS